MIQSSTDLSESARYHFDLPAFPFAASAHTPDHQAYPPGLSRGAVGLEGEGAGEGCHESARAGPTQRVDRCASSSRLSKGPRPTRYVVVPVDRVGAGFEAEQTQAEGIGWMGAGPEDSGGQTRTAATVKTARYAA